MKILARYITTIFIKNYFFSVIGLTALFVFQAILQGILDGSYPIPQIIWHEILGIPAILVQMTPPAILMATVLSLSGMTRTNELVACYSIGVGLRQVMAVILSLVFMVCCVMLVFQDRILPPLYKKKTTFYWREMKKRPDFFLDVQKDKIWYRSNNLIYNLRTFDTSKNRIIGLSVYTFDREFELIQLLEAKEADYTPEGWKLHDGTVTVFSRVDDFPITKQFATRDLLIDETPKDFQEIEKEVEGLRLKELFSYIDRTDQIGADTKTYRVKFHSRISLSFIPLIMCFLAVPFSTRSRREGGLAKDLGICLLVTFFYWLFYSVSLSMGENGALPPPLAAWLPSIIFVGVSVLLLVRNRA